MTVLYESKYARLELDEARHIARYTRSAEPFEHVEDALRTFREIVAASAGVDRRRMSLLSDVRQAVGRNDEAFESAVAGLRDALFGGFRERAVLVRTMAGKLQVRRLNGVGGTALEAFEDEASALEFLGAK